VPKFESVEAYFKFQDAKSLAWLNEHFVVVKVGN